MEMPRDRRSARCNLIRQQKEIEELKSAAINNTSTNQQKNSVAEASTTNVKLSAASIEQNAPNPLSNYTTIHYTVPADAKNASLLITDVNGKTIKQIALSDGPGTINIDASALNAGTYNYTLVVDGKTIETKRMVIAK